MPSVGAPTLGPNAIPGDPAEVDGLSSSFRQSASAVTDIGKELVSIDPKGWEGQAADQLRDLLNKLPTEFTKQEQSFDSVADALSQFSSELHGFQAVARSLAGQIEEARSQLTAATAASADANSEVLLAGAQHANASGEAQLAQTATALSDANAAAASAAGRVSSLHGELAALERRAAANFAAYTAAAGRCAATVTHASHGPVAALQTLLGPVAAWAGREGLTPVMLTALNDFTIVASEYQKLEQGTSRQVSGSWFYGDTASGSGHNSFGSWKGQVQLGVSASGSASVAASLKGLSAQASGSFFAGEQGSFSAQAGNQWVNASVAATEMAGVSASGNAGVTLGLKGLDAQASGQAFAGVQANATGNADLGGVDATGTAGVKAGIGVDGSGTFDVSLTNIQISGQIGASLGIGGQLGGSIKLDPEQLGNEALAGTREVGDHFGHDFKNWGQDARHDLDNWGHDISGWI